MPEVPLVIKFVMEHENILVGNNRFFLFVNKLVSWECRFYALTLILIKHIIF